jgi:Mn-containing catalase
LPFHHPARAPAGGRSRSFVEGRSMFRHESRLQFDAKPDRPDAVFAKLLQEPLAGQASEMTGMMQFLIQGFNCRGPAKYRDLLIATGTEEIAHVELVATMIARLLEKAPVTAQEAAAAKDPVVGAVMGGMNPHHFIAAGLGAGLRDCVGVPWNAGYVTATGNLLADFRSNLALESVGRLAFCRLYQLTDDSGVRDMLRFLIARDTMHQNQFLAAIQELEEDGLETTPVPSAFPKELENEDVAYQFWNLTDGTAAADGRWASGKAPDGHGKFEFVKHPEPLGGEAELGRSNPRGLGTEPKPAKLAQKLVSGS